MTNENERETNGHESLPDDGPASGLIQAFAAAVATHRLYPTEHPSSVAALGALVAAMEPLFGKENRLCIESEKGGLRVNDVEVTRPPALANWLSDQLRRRLVKGVVISSQVEPGELGKLCLLFTKRAKGTDLREARALMDDVRGEHLQMLELEYRDEGTAPSPSRSLLAEDWHLAMQQTEDAVILPREANVLANRLEQMSLMHGYEEDVEEVDVFKMLAAAAAETFEEALPDDSYKMELLMTHIIATLDHQIEHEFEGTSTFRRRQVLGMAAQRILKKTPDLIVSIAESAGPLLSQIQTRSRGRNPGEMLTHLFMRTDRASEDVKQTVAKVTEAPEQKQRSTPLDPKALLEKARQVGKDKRDAPGAVDRADVAHHYAALLAVTAGLADTPERIKQARETLARFVAEEMSTPRPRMARDVAAILDGTTAALPLDTRKKIFSAIPCRALLAYLAQELSDQDECKRALRAAWEVMGDRALEEVVALASQGTDPAFGRLAAEALSDKLAPYIATSAGSGGPHAVDLAMAVADHLGELEQAEMFSKFVRQLGPEAPPSVAMRLARFPSVMALRVLRDWLMAAPRGTRTAFVDKLLGGADAGGLPIVADIALGPGVLKKAYAHRRAAVEALARAGTARGREVLAQIGASARWSLSAEKRALASCARSLEARMAKGMGGA